MNRNPNHTRTRQPLSAINVVPYIDVMLVLLIIFMVTTPLLTQGVKINLPQAQTQTIKKLSQTPIIVSVNAKGEYFLNLADHPKQAISAHDLLVRVSAEVILSRGNQDGSGQGQGQGQNQQRQVLVKGDRDAKYGQVVGAMALLKKAGVGRVGLVTDGLRG